MEIDFRFTAVAVLGTYAVVAILERVPGLRRRQSPFWRPFFATDVGWYLVAVVVTLAFGPTFEGLARGRATLGLPGLESLGLPWVAQVVIAIVLYDLCAFTAHVLLHRYDLLWRLHKVHHSSRVLDWLATTRAHGLEHLVRGIPTQALLFTLGVPTSALAVTLAIYTAFATLGHSNLRIDLSRIEWLFVTPRLHRLHHVPATTNRNFATIFTIWDRLLGRLVIKKEPERGVGPGERLGVPGEVDRYPQSWWRQLVEPFRVPSSAPGRPSRPLCVGASAGNADTA